MAFNHPNNQSNAEKNQSNQQQCLYNPYQGLQILVQKLYELPTQPEYLFQEESVRQRRSWGENLTYYIGCDYSAGADKGFIEGVRASESGDTLKLRVNRVLNASGMNGRQWRNWARAIGLMYAGIESGIVVVGDTDDVLNSVAAGLATWAI